MAGYARVFSSITESSLWSESKDARILFVSMLAKCDAAGFIEAAVPGLARLSNLTLDETIAAIAVLTGPDPHSKNPANEGRRIAQVPGGWVVLNYEEYRNRESEADRREYMREYMRAYRAGAPPVNTCKHPVNTVSSPVNPCKAGEHPVSPASASASASGGDDSRPPSPPPEVKAGEAILIQNGRKTTPRALAEWNAALKAPAWAGYPMAQRLLALGDVLEAHPEILYANQAAAEFAKWRRDNPIEPTQPAAQEGAS